MSPKRSGRQSAQVAQQTRDGILCTATTLFVEKGFSVVSLREIAEHAGVSHGLLRYHFGNKLAIWERICERAILDVLNEMELILHHLDPKLLPNYLFFWLISSLFASQLSDPRMMRLMVDGIRADEQAVQLFNQLPNPVQELLQIELAKVQQMGLLTEIQSAEIRWLICIFTDAPATLEPLMQDIYGKDLEQARLQHWRLCARMLAAMLNIEIDCIANVHCLADVLGPRAIRSRAALS